MVSCCRSALSLNATNCRKRKLASSWGDKVSTDKRRRTSSTPNGLGSAGAPLQSSSGGAAISYGRVVFTADALAIKTMPDLKGICRMRGLPVGGKKDLVVERILKSQAGPYDSGAGGP